ncbi:dihydrolipoyl dehydrogenase family protein [Nakamurella deserti]|uniref:dihydrolipoyl dehydrogenase family protein n=1 Tax=Nakamurella deserti TaxID=2164074 RepID=UPI000DBE4D43|nr:NAD(P)/FAD-dependent oxidoreductase [Nakamurella deserti]
MSDSYDVIVIGAGPVGENVADRAVQGGLTAVIVENELVGGECSYWACMPSKALLGPPLALAAARAIDGAKQAVTGSLDVEAVLARRTWFTGDGDDSGQVQWLESAHIDLVRGHGRLAGEKTVEVTTPDGSVRTLTARHAVAVCTGTTATVPPIDGLADARPWTSREATSAKTVPASLVVVGGGVVATEMATAYSFFGSKVTMLVRSGLLAGLEPFAGEMVADSLRELGADLRLGVSPTAVHRDGSGVHVTLDDGSTIDAAEILVATGRTPATSDVGLDTVGLPAKGYLTVDDTLRVDGLDWLYAVGDVNGRALLTHQGKYEARAAGDVIAARAAGAAVDDAPWGKHVATADHAAVPAVVFSHPEVASIGLTEAKAREKYPHVRVVDYDLGQVSGSKLHADGYRGQARMVVDTDREVVVGLTLVGAEVGEMIHAATIAVVGEVPISRLWHAVPSYPTMSEIWLRLLESYGR